MFSGTIVQIALARSDDCMPELFDVGEELRSAVFRQDLTKQVAQKTHLAAKCGRHLYTRDLS
jgi:hypothetical protein